MSDDKPTTELVIPEVVAPDGREDDGLAPPPEISTSGAELLAAALRSLKSPNTRKAYQAHWKRFAAFNGQKPGPFIPWFLGLRKSEALDLVHRFREHLEAEGKSVATIAAHMRAITSMIHRWHLAEIASWTLKGLVSTPVPQKYTDVQGVSEEGITAMLRVTAELGTPESARDLAILLLLHDSALRRREIVSLHTGHWRPEKRAVMVWSKGSAAGLRTKQPVSQRTVKALERYLELRGDVPGPLFCELPIADPPKGLDEYQIRRVTERAARNAGLTEPVSPHRLRHSGITYFARRIKDPDLIRRFARHSRFETTTIYIHAVDESIQQMMDETLED